MYKRLIFRYYVYFVTTLRLTKQAQESDLYGRPSANSHVVKCGGRYECKVLSQGKANSLHVRFREKNAYEEIHVSVPITDTGELVE